MSTWGKRRSKGSRQEARGNRRGVALGSVGTIVVVLASLAHCFWEQLEWETTCKGEERVYRLRLTHTQGLSSSGQAARNKVWRLHFLGEDGKSRYRIRNYGKRAREKFGDRGWRFEHTPRRLPLPVNQGQPTILHGDEQAFEIAFSLDQIDIARKEGILRLPCKPGKRTR